MFKRITAVLAAVLLGVGISVVSVAAPASAHTPSYDVGCSALWVNPTSYETRSGDPKPNKITVKIDGATVLDTTFGTSLAKQTFTYDGTTSHTWSIVIDAVGGSGPDTQYDKTFSGVTTPCKYPSRDIQMTCGSATAILGAALANGNHINMEVEINGVKKTLNAYVGQNIPGGYTGGGWNGAGLRFADINGVQTKVPLTEQQIKSGTFTFPYGDYLGGATSYKVVWAQMETVYFNKTKELNAYLVCGPQTTPVTVQAAPSATAPTCDAAGSLVVPAQTGIVWSGGSNGDGPGSYTLVATAAEGYTLSGQSVFPVTVLPKKSGAECAPPCIPNTAVSYTYDPETNSGVIHVENVDGSSGELCKPFWVTATSWKFIEGNKQWSQVRDQVQYLDLIDKPGDYPYSAPVECGQGDIYAAWFDASKPADGQPLPPKYLHGPSDPWAEHFLHQMGFTGPNPTWTVDSPGCNIVVPETPIASVIDECGEWGSVQVPSDSKAFTYTTQGDPTHGTFTVTATVNEGYVVQEGAQTVFVFELGEYHPCIQECTEQAEPVLATNLDQAGWTFTSAGDGSVEFVENGLKVTTTATTDSASGVIAVDVPLVNIGSPSASFASSTGAKPALQLHLDADGDGTVDGVLTEQVGFAGELWTSATDFGVGGDGAHASLATLQDYLDANPDAKVLGVGFTLAGAVGDAEVTSLDFGCLTFAFDLVVVDPQVTVQVGACYPDGDVSSKTAYFVFDNSASDVPVTFSVPGAKDVDGRSDAGTPADAGIVVTVAAHTTSQPIPTTPYQHNAPVGYDVYADGELLEHVEFPAFSQCQEKLVPGDPIATPQVCDHGELKAGGIWVEQLPGKLEYSITGGDLEQPLVVTAADGYTELPPGTYLVTVVGLNGFEIEGSDAWPYEITVGEPVRCDTIDVPVVPATQITCAAAGTYTLPTAEHIQWWVDGVQRDPFTYKVFTTENVEITAKIVTEGVFFADGSTSKTWTEEFVAPTDDCQLIDHPLVYPTSTHEQGTCSAPPTFTLSDTMGVQWVLNDTDEVDPGTHTAKWGETVKITATLPDPINYGFDEGQQTEWNYTFTAAPKDCNLVALALTGLSTGGFVPWIGGALLLLGGAGIYFQRRLIAAKK